MSDIKKHLKWLMFRGALDRTLTEPAKKVYKAKTDEEKAEYLKYRIEKLRLQAEANLKRKDDLTLRLIRLLSGKSKKD